MYKRNLGASERLAALVIGLMLSFGGAVIATYEASKYFWGQQHLQHVTHSGARFGVGMAVVLVSCGIAVITLALIGVTVTNGSPSPPPPPKKR